MLVKFGMDGWIYVVLGIAWVVYSIYKGVNKNKTQEEKVTDSPKKPSFLENLLVEFDQGNPTTDAEPSNDNSSQNPEGWIHEEPSEIKLEAEELVEEDKAVEEGVPTAHVSPADSPPFSDNKTRRKPPRVNLKKAVILSEILHRPYE